MAIAWLAVAWMGGIASIFALALCWWFLGVGAGDSAQKHGISDSLSSRVGGVVVVGYTCLNLAYLWLVSEVKVSEFSVLVLSCGVAFFSIGLFEDLKGDVSAKLRLILMLLISAFFVISEPRLRLQNVGVPIVDELLALSAFGAIVFTILCLSFLPNAFNTADGANGLVGGVGLITLVTMATALPTELSILQMSSAVGCAVFLVFNLYTGRFFLGDGGAYALGALIGCSMIFLALSKPGATWFLLALVFYPIADLIWSIVRRFISGLPIYKPDNLHLHNLLHTHLRRRLAGTKTANNVTGIIIVTIFCLIPALFTWSGLLRVDDYRWVFIVCGQWVVYAVVWRRMRGSIKS